VQSRHESESEWVDERVFESNQRMTSDRVMEAQLLDGNRLEFQVEAKQKVLAIKGSFLVLDAANNRRIRLWWRARQGRRYIRRTSLSPGNHRSRLMSIDGVGSGEVVTDV
jgi:hypothetical protein